MAISPAGQYLHSSDFESVFVRLCEIKVLWNQLSPVGSGNRLWQSQTRLPEGHDAFSHHMAGKGPSYVTFYSRDFHLIFRVHS